MKGIGVAEPDDGECHLAVELFNRERWGPGRRGGGSMQSGRGLVAGNVPASRRLPPASTSGGSPTATPKEKRKTLQNNNNKYEDEDAQKY